MMIMLPSSSSTTSSPASSRLSLLTSSSSISSTLSASVPSSSSKTHAFFGSPFSDSSSPPLPPPYDDTPKVDTHPPPRSLNTDFFSTSPPTIPSSPTSSPPRKTILPPLSRFFPSRARLSSRTTHPQFFHLDTSSPPSPTSSPEPESPSSAERASPDPSSHHPNLSHPVHPLKQGDVLADSALSLELLRTLGQGAFSSVWLAKDLYSQLPALESSRRSSLVRSRSKKKNRPIDGTSHQRALTDANGRLVAVKMTDRRLCDRNDRSRVSFIREVQVLRVPPPSPSSLTLTFANPPLHSCSTSHIPQSSPTSIHSVLPLITV